MVAAKPGPKKRAQASTGDAPAGSGRRKKAPAKAKAKAKPKAKPKTKAKAKAKAKPGAKTKAAGTPKRKRTTAKKTAPANPAPITSRFKNRAVWRARAVRAAKWSGIAAAAFLVSTFLWALTYRWVDPPRTPLMIGRALFDGASTQQQWRDLDATAAPMILAVIAAEDQRFFQHRGFDFVELRAAWAAHQEGARLRGASTLSQQTAKNVFLLPTRSWLRKGLEVYFTGLIEVLWGKRRILEVYMNVAETGPGIYGVDAAMQHYFGHSAATATRSEAAAIAAVLPNPRERDARAPSAQTAKRRDWIAGQMHNLGGTAYLAPLKL